MYNMRVLLFIFVLLCALFVSNTVAKKCNSMDIRNNVTELEKLRNCTIITGYLYVVLIESNMPKDINEYSFPELREVTDLIIFYRLKHLVNLGKLFPNLAVIRGRDLLQDYALIIYEMSSLREVGLYNLKKIDRGGVRIDKNPELCYVNTVDWKRITIGHVYTGSQSYDRCPPCPADCEESFCWNNSTCQQTVASSNCHPECLDGCNGPYDNHCFLCRNVSEDDRCVPKCSPERYLLVNMSTCLTAEMCRSLDGEWFTFHNQCMNTCPPKYKKVNTTCEYCGSLCPKICNGSLISDMDTMQKMKGCTNITGALEIKIENRIPNLEKELTENLGSIEEIRDYLKVYRSTAIHSLNFLKSLHTIRGVTLEHNLFSLLIYENANLQKLWDWDNLKLKILRGTFSFHYNSKLCMSEIEKLKQLTNSSENMIFRRNGTDVSPLSNGDKFGCTYTNVTVRIVDVGETNVSMECEVPTEFQKTVGYLVYYRVAATANTSIVDEDVCDVQPWATVLVSQDNRDNASFITLSWNISDLDPYTKYSFYVRHAYQHGSYSQLQQFMTLSGDPSVPKDVVAEPYASDAIRLTWVPPIRTNGNLSHYEIFGYVLDDDQNFIDQRDYCRNSMLLNYPKIKAKPDPVTESPKLNDTCSCTVTTLPPIHQDFDAICTALDRNIYMEPEWSYSRSCSRYMYEVVTSHEAYNKLQKRSGQQSADDEVVHNVFSKFKRTASKESTSFVIDKLRHFSQYVILIVACNHNRTEQSQCSSVVMVSQRTGPRPGADDVHGVRVEPVDMSSVDVHWLQPDQPNAAIVNYDLEYRNVENENSQTQKICLTRLQHQREGSRYRLRHLHPGRYRVHVRATSLAGPGNFSSYVQFDIAMPSQSISVAAVVVTLLMLVLMVTALVCYWRYKVRRSLENMHLIANVNPDYAGYKEDEWEIDRSNIEIYQELGKGTFGQVFNGLIKNKNMPCAIKTINEQATMHDKMEFLNEASVMKSFNEAHHVVRLLGVVSRGHCPLVIMELMARGDLKSFLRSTRDSSTSLTCSEMYRMAAEIADGMAYLAAKKYVHRDLAARNCMVSSDRTVKIGDFGMTRDIYETDYYRKETRGLLPVRWMAPESLADGVFTTDSDVWSYGIVLWEIATLAEQPYQGLANEQVLQFVVSRGTLERPLQCPDLLYDIMEACWKWYPPGRPMFTDIVEKLEAHVGQDFRLVSFYHSREGEDYRMHKQELKDARIANISALSLGHAAAHWARQTDDVHFQVQPASRSPTTSANSYHSPPNDYLPYPLSSSAPRFGI